MKTPARALHPTATKIVLTLVDLAARHPTVTITDLAAAADIPRMTVYHHLVKLRGRGLVDWADGRDGTLRPAVAPVPFGP
jgi:DNA-binding IclR family transcriptional regulator